jgi:ABC-type branched-subunit amino acid transport system substrate-binding protein
MRRDSRCIGHLLMVLMTWALLPAFAAPQQRTKVGVIVGTTGLAAASGLSVKRGIELADRSFDGANKVDFIFEDDSFQAKNAVSAADKLISHDHVDALITFSGSTSLAVSLVAERRGVPMVAVTALSKVSAGSDLIRTIFVPPDDLARMIGAEVVLRQVARVALITSTQEALLGLRTAIRASLLEHAAHTITESHSFVVFDEEIVPGDVELSSLTSRMLQRNPDVIISLTLPPQSATLAKLLRNQKYAGKVIVGPPTYNYQEISAAQGALAGALLVGPLSGPSSGFFRLYHDTFHEQSVAEGMYGYDAATLLIEAAASGDIKRFLAESKSMKGAAGVYIKDAENLFAVPGEMKVITSDGRVVRYGT